MARQRLRVGAVVVVLALAGCSGSGPTDAPAGSATTPDGPVPPSTGPAVPVEGMPTWEPVAGLTVPRDDFVTAVVDGRIWVLGGMTGDRGNRLESIEVYEPAVDAWRLSDITLPQGLASFEGVGIGDEIFVFGGLDASSSATDFSAVLDTRTGRWRRLPPLPHARYAHTVTEHDGRIYVIGGEADSGPVRAVDVFDPRRGTWSGGGAMPDARGSHDAVSTEDGIYVLGGWLDGHPSDVVQVYDPRSGDWTRAAPLPEPVSRAGATVADGKLWVSFHEFAAALDLRTGVWSPANHPPLSRHGLGFVALDGRVYAIAGCQEWPLRDVRTVDVLTLPG